jgi:O-antigen ligase
MVNESRLEARPDGHVRPSAPLPWHILLLIAAIAAGVVAQGGFYPPGRILVLVLCGAALVAALGYPPARSRRQVWAVVAAAGALAVWALGRAAVQGSIAAGLSAAAVLACMAAGLLVLQRADAAQRELCALSLVGIGVLVAVSGWIGVAGRVPPVALSFEEQAARRLWRATSTFTYANAAAAMLAVLAVLAAALLIAHPRSVVRQAAVFLLLVGLGATLSRGGALALVVGLVLLAVLTGVRATVRHLAPPVLGAVVAVAALVPSFPDTARPQPLLAATGLAVGLGVTLGLARLPGRARLMAVLAAFVAIAVGAGLFITSRQGFAMMADSRASTSSPTRTESAAAALRLAAEHPIAGVGPGRAVFTWTVPDGRMVSGRYAHNEYLQVLVELGGIGLLLLLLLLAVTALLVRQGRATAPSVVLWSGAVAAATALLVHSGLDFLWQLPVIPLTGALLAGLAGPVSHRTGDGLPETELG